MTPLALLVSAGSLTALVAAAVVHADATRNDLSPPGRRAWTVAVGAASFGGFLVPHLFREQLRYVYFRIVKPRPVATSPYEILAVDLATGVTISAAAAFLYLLGSRYGPFARG